MRPVVGLGVGLGMVLGLPLLGVWLAGLPIERYLEFPPRTVYVEQPGFSWLAAAAIGTLVLVTVGAWLFFPAVDAPPAARAPPPRHTRAFPRWGYAGLLAGLATWFLAWNRFAWFAPLQPHVFTPLWVSYIVVVNALTRRRSGRCMLLDEPRHFWLLVPASAAFWWTFEYLNRFVQNWYYLGVTRFGPLEYVLAATFPFATVLPAVLGTHELISTFPVLERFRHRRPLTLASGRRLALTSLALSSVGLALVGVLPGFLFPLLWVSPLLIMVSLCTLQGRPHLFTEVAAGDWRRFTSAALAALACGFFWEMWNHGCETKWIYAVPYVDRWHIFEMPLLGYAGYLPFGLECLVVGDLLPERS